MTRLTLIAGLLAIAASTSAAAETKTGREAAANAAPDDVICTYEKTLGSNLKRRVCATRATRDEQSRQDREAMRNLKAGSSRGTANSDPGF